MNTFIRAVVSGFGFSLGAALYKKVSRRLGLDEESKNEPPPDAAGEQEQSEGDGEAEHLSQ